MNKKYFVKDLINSEGLVGDTLLLLVKKDQRRTKSNTPFLDFILRDRTGEIEGKVWSDNLNRVQADLNAGDIVHIEFTVNGYQGRMELVIRSMKKVEVDDLSEYTPETGFDVELLKQELIKRIDSIRDYSLRKLIDSFFNDDNFKEEFINAPAGERIHHDYRHGLLQHSLEILTILDSMHKIYPDMNMDLLTVGALLHDIGKLKENRIDPTGTINRTMEGRLLGHVVIGIQMIQERMPKDFPNGLRLQIFHLVASHQGKLETGSPVLPACPEAYALYYADLTSTFLNIVGKMKVDGKNNGRVQAGTDGLFSEYNKYLGTSVFLGDGLDL
jgi:3'-5' exoribonuclease